MTGHRRNLLRVGEEKGHFKVKTVMGLLVICPWGDGRNRWVGGVFVKSGGERWPSQPAVDW